MKSRWLTLIALMTLAITACTQQLPSGAMEYSTAFEHSIPVGQSLPGTDIKYLGKTGQGAQMSIGGQSALKQTFDSLTWSGEPAPDVSVDYNLRVISFDDKVLQAGGAAKVAVSNVKPQAVSPSSLPQDALTFKGVVTYSVAKGKTIPGTTITYDGKTPDGAKLGGIEGYAFRKEADSIVWFGKLTDKCFLQLDLRLVFYTDSAMQVTGPVTLYLKP
jgi:hypothetical protein